MKEAKSTPRIVASGEEKTGDWRPLVHQSVRKSKTSYSSSAAAADDDGDDEKMVIDVVEFLLKAINQGPVWVYLKLCLDGLFAL